MFHDELRTELADERLAAGRLLPGAQDFRIGVQDKAEAALSAAVQSAGLHLSATSWDTLCDSFSREFNRLNRR